MIKHYKYDYDNGEAEVTLEIDTDVFTEENAKSYLEFFSWDYDKNEDPRDEYLKKVAIKCIEVATFDNYNSYGVLDEFNLGIEGWPRLDGTYGIKLIQVSQYEFSERKFDIEVIDNAQPMDIPKPKYE